MSRGRKPSASGATPSRRPTISESARRCRCASNGPFPPMRVRLGHAARAGRRGGPGSARRKAVLAGGFLQRPRSRQPLGRGIAGLHRGRAHRRWRARGRFRSAAGHRALGLPGGVAAGPDSRHLDGGRPRHAGGRGVPRSAALPEAQAAEICRIVLMQVLPACVTGDADAFGAGITRMQDLVGDHFAPHRAGAMPARRWPGCWKRLRAGASRATGRAHGARRASCWRAPRRRRIISSPPSTGAAPCGSSSRAVATRVQRSPGGSAPDAGPLRLTGAPVEDFLEGNALRKAEARQKGEVEWPARSCICSRRSGT